MALCRGGNRRVMSWRRVGTSFLWRRCRSMLRHQCWILIWRWDDLRRVLGLVGGRNPLTDTSLRMMTWGAWDCLLRNS